MIERFFKPRKYYLSREHSAPISATSQMREALPALLMTDTANIKRQFRNSLKRGTGEAYLLLKDNPNIDFSNHIIQGALKIYAYDGQSEGNRAQYNSY